MTRTLLVRALFAGTAMMMSTAAFAQEADPQPDTSDATADARDAAGALPMIASKLDCSRRSSSTP